MYNLLRLRGRALLAKIVIRRMDLLVVKPLEPTDLYEVRGISPWSSKIKKKSNSMF